MRFYKAWVQFEDGHFRYIELEASSEDNARIILKKQWPACTRIDVKRT